MIPLASLSFLCRCYLSLIGFSLAGSIFAKVSGLDPGPIAPVASALTIGCGFLAVFEPIFFKKNWPAVAVIAAALAGSFLIEVFGVFTGLPFGRYTYTSLWQPTIRIEGHPFPALLPFAWLLMVGASAVICSKSRYPIVSAGLLATACDLLMEPVMTGPLIYWRWLEPGPLPGGAPLLNPIGWLLVASLIAWLLSKIKLENRQSGIAVLAGHLALIIGIGAIATIPR
jgi:uncharacterized membrane protein